MYINMYINKYVYKYVYVCIYIHIRKCIYVNTNMSVSIFAYV